MLGRPGPEYKAVSGILEARFDIWPLQPQEKGVNNKLLEVRRQKFLLLLFIPLDTMGRVESLNLCLWRSPSVDYFPMACCKKTVALVLFDHGAVWAART
jgi:hypothetical protein